MCERPTGDRQACADAAGVGASGGKVCQRFLTCKESLGVCSRRHVHCQRADAGMICSTASPFRKRAPTTKGVHTTTEPPRVCRRLQPLRDWGHETGKEVLPRGAGAGGSDGVRARERVLLAVGCHPVYCGKDRLLW